MMMKKIISDRVKKILEWNSILEELKKRCLSVPGQGYAQNITPLPDESIKKQLNKISELKDMILQKESPDLSNIPDIAHFLELAKKKGTLKLEDLFEIRKLILSSNRFRGYLKSNRENLELLQEELSGLSPLEDIGKTLIPAVTDNAELNISLYPALKRLEQNIFDLKQDIEKKLLSIINSPRYSKALQEKIFTVRGDRYVLLVKAPMKNQVKGTVHDISSSGATLFIEPSAVSSDNSRLRLLELEFQVETGRILKELTEKVAQSYYELLNNQGILAYIDFLNAAAGLSISIKGSAPLLTEKEIVLYNARHPLLSLMSPEAVVGNDISIGKNFNCLIISGANTGGKTVLLKTLGLLCMMVLHGLHISAGENSCIGIFEKIFADIGDDQNLEQSLSSFSGQILIMKEMLSNSDNKSLVLIDEIIASTNPRQGAALSQAILEQLVETGAVIIITTHYSELKELASVDSKYNNASAAFDTDSFKPTYKMNQGIPGVSYALEIAKIYGLPENILSRSKELLDSRELSIEELTEKMQKFTLELEEEKNRIKTLEESLSREKILYREKEKDLKLRIEEIKKEKGIEFLDEINEYRKKISQRIKDLEALSIQEAARVQKEISETDARIRDKLIKDAKKNYTQNHIPFDPDTAKKGDTVLVSTLGKKGILDNIDKQGKSALIIMGNSIKSRFPFSELFLSSEKEEKGESRKQGSRRKESNSGKKGISITIQTRYNTIDLRGMRVEEALTKLDNDMDSMVRTGIDTAVIIHGHGTGAMKDAVREHIKFSSYVTVWRPGEYGEGGDGVTIAGLIN